MIRSDRIKSEIFGSVGFRDETISDYPTIDSANKGSVSGLYFQDAVSFASIQNIYDCQHDADLTEVNFNLLLKQMQEAVILESCQKIQSNESDFISSTNVFPYEKSFKNTITPENRFVGFQIKKNNNSNKISKVNWVELALDSAVAINLYLYNSNKPNEPIKTKSITTIANESVVVSLDDWFIADSSTYKGGTFYLGYFESDLGEAKAMKKDYELADLQVSTICTDICPVNAAHESTIVDFESITEVNETYGLNFCIDTYTDYTEFFVRNKSMLYQVIYYQMAEKIYYLIKTSTRSNLIERITSDYINNMSFEIYGNKEAGIEGINGRLKREIDNIKKALFYKPLISRGTLR